MTLNIIIRTSYRPAAFHKCITSVLRNLPLGCEVEIIVGYDNIRALDYLSKYPINVLLNLTEFPKTGAFFYNSYLNELIEYAVEPGWCLFVDDDDEVIDWSLDTVIDRLIPERSAIVPFMRGDFMKPTKLQIKLHKIYKGYIGLPSLILSTGHRHLVHFDDTEYSDFNAIDQLIKSVPSDIAWLATPVVYSARRGNGVLENFITL